MVEAFGKRIRQLRLERQLSQKELAERMFVAKSSISRWESGRRLPDISMLSRLAECLDVDTRELLNTMRESCPAGCILVVDDEPVNLRGCVSILERTLPGTAVAGFQEGAPALAFAREHPVAVAFLDVELSTGNGVDLAGKLLELNPRINLVFLTGHPDYMGDAFHLHASGYILKPLTPEKLRHELSHLRFPIPLPVNAGQAGEVHVENHLEA